MTVGYIIQIHGSTITYAGRNGVSTDLPRFFKSPTVVRDYAKRHNKGNNVRVIRVPYLEEGVDKTRNVEIMEVDAFVEKYCGPKAKAPLTNPKAVYMLRKPMNPDSDDPVIYEFKRMKYRSKMPHVWNRAGDVRSHMSFNSYNDFRYTGWEVMEIVYNDDFTVARTTVITDAVAFYTRSPSCRARYNKWLERKKK